ncbi:MAG: HipA domain-containing protein [Mariprofundales bacterium]
MNPDMTIYQEAFVWIWLPGEVDPVVAGKLTAQGETLVFNYGQSYLARDNAISIYAPELPLKSGHLPLIAGLRMPGCIRDGSPDGWGRRVMIHRQQGRYNELDELFYLLESGSDRVGGLDFQRSASHYAARSPSNVPLAVLLEAAERLEKGLPIPQELDQALNHGTSIGGARPKALVEEADKKYIAKFSSTGDLYNAVKAEFVSMRLATACGLDVTSVSMRQVAGKEVLLVERFDRIRSDKGWQRRCVVSVLTLLGLDEMMARYASYEDLAEIIRHRFRDGPATLRELFGRISFNILTGNTDDHARNHSALWDGERLSLAPAYDICPQGRAGNEASQAMLISGGQRMSRLSVCMDGANVFLLGEQEACDIIAHQINTIACHWSALCDAARLTAIDRKLFVGRQFLNPYAFDDLEGGRRFLKNLADDARRVMV